LRDTGNAWDMVVCAWMARHGDAFRLTSEWHADDIVIRLHHKDIRGVMCGWEEALDGAGSAGNSCSFDWIWVLAYTAAGHNVISRRT